MTDLYAYTRRRDPTTGEVLFTGNNWIASPSPQAERVLMILRTPRGTCLVDPSLGVEWSRVDKLGTGAASTARDVILAALAFVVAAGDITALVVSCEVDVQRGLLLYDVSFSDPRLDRRARIRGEV